VQIAIPTRLLGYCSTAVSG